MILFSIGCLPTRKVKHVSRSSTHLPIDNLQLLVPSPPKEYIGWMILVNDKTLQWSLEPRGSWTISLLAFISLAILPVAAAFAAVYLFKSRSYSIIVNRLGRLQYEPKNSRTPSIINFQPMEDIRGSPTLSRVSTLRSNKTLVNHTITNDAKYFRPATVLMATLEYDIPDWKVKVRIGGLGVIASLMGTHMNDRYAFTKTI